MTKRFARRGQSTEDYWVIAHVFNQIHTVEDLTILLSIIDKPKGNKLLGINLQLLHIKSASLEFIRMSIVHGALASFEAIRETTDPEIMLLFIESGIIEEMGMEYVAYFLACKTDNVELASALPRFTNVEEYVFFAIKHGSPRVLNSILSCLNNDDRNTIRDYNIIRALDSFSRLGWRLHIANYRLIV